MKIISFIEEEPVIKKILKHLNLWMVQNHDPPNNSPPENILNLIDNNYIEASFKNNSVSLHTFDALTDRSFHYHNSLKKEPSVYISQMLFEDDYSQAGCMDEQ